MRLKRNPAAYLILLFWLACASFGCTTINLEEHPLLKPEVDQSLHEVKPFNPAASGKGLAALQEGAEKDQLERLLSKSPEKRSLSFSLPDVRRATLQNNLDLTTAFFDPAISGAAVDVERAKFEATFNLTAQRSKSVSPEFTASAGTLVDTTVTETVIQPVLNIPLVTGGTVTLGPLLSSYDYEATTGGDKFWQSSGQISLTQPLLRNAGPAYNKGSIILAMYQQQIDTARTKLAVINTLLNAEVGYWTVFSARRVLEIQREQYDLYRQELSDSKKLEQGGVRTMADVYGFEAGLATQVSRVVQADNDLRQAVRELKVLMNDPTLSLNDTVRIEPTTKPRLAHFRFDTDALVRAAIQNRMEVLESELQIAADSLGIRLAKNQTLPQVDVTLASVWNGFSPSSYEDSTDRLLHGSDSSGWNVGLVASIPIGNKAAKAHLRSAVLQRLREIANRNQRKLTVAKDVLRATDALETAWQLLLAARYRVEASRKNFVAEKKLFSLGNRTSTDVSAALLQLGDAKVAEAQAEAAYQISMAQLAAATGSLLGYSGVEWATGTEKMPIPPGIEDAK